MIHSTASVSHYKKFSSLTWAGWFLFVLGVSALIGVLMVSSSPKPAFIAWLLFFSGLAVILYQPRYGIYLIIFFSLVGDKSLIPWYPFLLNFSSEESLLFLGNRFIFSPVEIYLVVTLFSWWLQGVVLRKFKFYKGELFWPMLVFLGFVVFGLVYGIVRNGNINIALWEARAIFYLPVMFVLTSNLITEPKHISWLMVMVTCALFIEGFLAVSIFIFKLNWNLGIISEGLTEHSAGIHMSSLIIFILALWLYKASFSTRLSVLLLGAPVLLTFLINQRRSAVFALLIALIFMAFFLYKENRFVFWILIPVATIVFGSYMVAFWNNTGPLGFPAQALKSQIARSQSSAKDQGSDIYRIMENYDIYYTIKQAPLTGIGFGHMFSMPLPLPDISFFVWYRYVTHNSIGWFWMKTGMGGFISMLFLVGLSIMYGIRALFRISGGLPRAAILTAVLYILMHFVFAYVDMSWDSQSMSYLGMMMGLIGCVERISGVNV